MRLSTSLQRRTPRRFLLAFLLLVNTLFVSGAFNADLSRERPGDGPLGVSLDYHLAVEGPGVEPSNDEKKEINPIVVFTSHLTFNKPVNDISDGQLFQLAQDGVAEMAKNAQDYGIARRNLPGVITVLAYDKEIILSSSQRGSLSFTYDYGESPVKRILERCLATLKHGNRGGCGEQIGAHLLYKLHPQGSVSRVKAVTVTRGTKTTDPSEYIAPCGSDLKAQLKEIPGCLQFIRDQRWDVISRDVKAQPYKLEEIAGGLAKTDQPSLCANYHN